MSNSSWFQVDYPLEVGHGEVRAPNIIRRVVTVSMCVAAAFWWAVKSNILVSMSSFAKAIRELVLPPDLLTPLDKRAQRDLDEVRGARFHTAVHVILPPLVVVNICHAIVQMSTGRPLYECMGKLWLVLIREFLARYCSHFSPRVIASVYKASMSVFVVQMLLVEGPSGIPGRVMAGIVLLDCSVSLKHNVLFSAIYCFVTWKRQAQGGLPVAESLGHVMQEIHTCVFVCSILLLVEAGDRGRIRASVLSRQSGTAQQAVQRMLSAFCDAQLHIGPEMQIFTHSRPLVHFLGSGAGDVDTQDAFRGDCFLRHVTASDQQRFQEFLAATSALQSEGGDAHARAAGAPASIQVSLQSRGGGSVPVELFVVALPDLDDTLGFLMASERPGCFRGRRAWMRRGPSRWGHGPGRPSLPRLLVRRPRPSRPGSLRTPCWGGSPAHARRARPAPRPPRARPCPSPRAPLGAAPRQRPGFAACPCGSTPVARGCASAFWFL
ncbi:unnamed protein product [Prorocentrum cordatum]|uniref:Protein RFT1 homolog n=1 Tax=Prorocentrum cordatum TaxID=2364126 RepID=A0ABN9PTN6_9DINO|nr:unnamed protein product [Polarella glacialis]